MKPYVGAVRHLVGLMARIRDRHGITLPELDIGGGHAVAHRPGEHPLVHGITLPVLDIGGGHAVAHRPGEHPLDVPEPAAACAANSPTPAPGRTFRCRASPSSRAAPWSPARAWPCTGCSP